MDFRFVIGIDLGTTSCGLSYFDLLNKQKGVQSLKILQWESEGATISNEILPSYCYLPSKSKIKNGTFDLPFETLDPNIGKWVCGRFAKEQKNVDSEVVVHSAKSWLCHHAVDAHDRILPWHSDQLIGEKRISPIQASALYLKHLKEFWNYEFAQYESDYQLEKQKIVITVPASFNELASDLTLQAAELAGFNIKNVTLLEEPQAVFYHWRFHQDQEIDSPLKDYLNNQEKIISLFPQVLIEPKIILVCDIGGGTTDFSLLKLQKYQQLEVERIEVSNHILLGGDNIDLLLASRLEKKYLEKAKVGKLNSKQWNQLIGEARALKEKALAVTPDDQQPLYISIYGTGNKLLGSTVTISITPHEIKDCILENFFPICSKVDMPKENNLGIQEWGLPYPKDSRISVHLADFLRSREIDGILFAGGTLVPKFLRERIYTTVQAWQSQRPIKILENESLELSVTKGAAWFGLSSTIGVGKIVGGYPRNLFIEMALKKNGQKVLICVLPKGFVGTEKIILNQVEQEPIYVLIGRVVSFKMYYSESHVGSIAPGTVIKSDHERDSLAIKSLAPLQTKLDLPNDKKNKLEKLHQVKLEFDLSLTGLLSINCVSLEPQFIDSTWQLKFNVQDAEVKKGHDDHAKREGPAFKNTSEYINAKSKILEIYGKPKAVIAANPNKLSRELEKYLGPKKDQWTLEQLRVLWDPLGSGESKRTRSESHETTWLNLAGYMLRPGYGDLLDAYRIAELWKVFEKGLAFPKGKQTQSQWWIMWRRVAGGLNRSQQETLFAKISPLLRKGVLHPELYLLAGSLELVSMDKKVKLADRLVEQVCSQKTDHVRQKIWAISRMASRVPLYGGPEHIIRPSFVERWIDKLIDLDINQSEYRMLHQFFIQSCRMIGDREFDINFSHRQKVLAKIADQKDFQNNKQLLTSVVPMDAKSSSVLFGESLPSGFII